MERASLVASTPSSINVSSLDSVVPGTASPTDGSMTSATVAGAGLFGNGGSDDGNPLKRTLTTLDLTAIGIGGIIGAGIYVLTGAAASLYAGPAVVISFVISGIGCGFSALCYAELAAMIPLAGSAYSFASASLGELPGWIVGWLLLTEYLFGAAAVAVGWSSYLNSLLRDLGGPIPIQLSKAPIEFDPKDEAWHVTGGYFNLPAVAVVLLCTALNVYGIQETARANNVIVLIKASVLVIFIIAGAFYVKPENWQPFVPPEEGVGRYGVTGIFRGSAVVFFAYIGFDSISASAQEALDPQRSLPIATMVSLFVATGLYIAVAVVLTGLVSYKALNTADPLAVAVDAAGEGLRWLRPVVKVGAVLGLSSVVLVLIMGQVRIFFAMAEDGLLPSAFGRVHPRFKTPIFSTVLTGVLAAFAAGLLPIDVLGELVSIGTLAAFISCALGVISLRRKQPHMHRPFRTPWVPWVPLAGAFVAAVQMISLPGGTWWRFAIWVTLGLLVYFLYSRKHAKRSGNARNAFMSSMRNGTLGGAVAATSADLGAINPITGRLAAAADDAGSGGVGRASSLSYGTGAETSGAEDALVGPSPLVGEWGSGGAPRHVSNPLAAAQSAHAAAAASAPSPGPGPSFSDFSSRVQRTAHLASAASAGANPKAQA